MTPTAGGGESIMSSGRVVRVVAALIQREFDQW